MDKNLIQAFGQTLRTLRDNRGLSQEDLALEADLDRTFISMLERGVRQPTLTTLFQLSDVLKVPMTELIRRVELELRQRRDQTKTMRAAEPQIVERTRRRKKTSSS